MVSARVRQATIKKEITNHEVYETIRHYYRQSGMLRRLDFAQRRAKLVSRQGQRRATSPMRS
jgi:hypothetical protein